MTNLDAALVDAEALLSQFLRAQDEMVAEVDDRVYTVIPTKPTWPLLRLTRVGGGVAMSRPRRIDRPLIQLEAYGGSKKAAHDLIELACQLIAGRILGIHDDLGVVAAYRFGPLSYLPDNTYTPSRPRYVADVELTTRPLTQAAGS